MAEAGLCLLGDIHPLAARDALGGWSGPVWIAESPQGADALVTAAVLRAAAPQRPVGFAVLVSALRHPWATANACRTLAAGGGPVRLGIGVGDEGWKRELGLGETRTLAALGNEIANLRTALAAAPARWTGAQAPPRIPIYIGAEGPRMTALAAHAADGLILPFLRTDALLRQRAATMKSAAPGTRVIAEVVVGVAESAEAAAGKLRRWLQFMMQAPHYREILAAAGLAAGDHARLQRQTGGETAATLPLAVLRALCVLGTAQQCAAEIRQRFFDWSDEVILVTPGRYLADLVQVGNELQGQLAIQGP